jgi:DNA-binding CsgD family transcriptional regulator
MVLIHHPTFQPAVDPILLRAAFELTLAEARIAAALIRGLEPVRLAQEQGVSINTVRKHTATIFRKLGVGRIQDLITLVHASPFAAFGLSGIQISYSS